MRNLPLRCLTWAAILAAAGWGSERAPAQYPPDDRYPATRPAGQSPGTQPWAPAGPAPPVAVSRPANWPGRYDGPAGGCPGGAPEYVAPSSHAPPSPNAVRSVSHQVPHVSRLPSRTPNPRSPQGAASHSEVAHAQPFLGAHVVARVGKEVVTVSDVLAQIPTIIDRNRANLPEEALEEQREALTRDLNRAIEEAFARQNGPPDRLVIQSEQLRAQMLGQVLQSRIQTLLVFLDAQRTIPEEGFPEVRRQIDEGFEKQVVPDLMKRVGADSRRELEEALRSRGTSLEREKRTFFQQTLAQQWIRQHVDMDEEITYEQMLDYYRKHLEDFDRPAETVWEQLCVQFVDQPSRQAAHAAIAAMGNRVVAGEPFDEVAKEASQGPTASDGGRRVFPDERHLSEELERAISGLPIGQLSPIVRDWRGLHIIRVVERTPAGRVPFEKAQEEIREKIREERLQKQLDEYLEELTRRTSVWTVLDAAPSEPHASSPRPRR